MKQNTRSRTPLAGLLRNSGRDRHFRVHLELEAPRTERLPRRLTLTPIPHSEARKEAGRLSANASCTNCAMLTGFDEDTSSIIVLVGRQ